jgi:alpha-L-fucosidase
MKRKEIIFAIGLFVLIHVCNPIFAQKSKADDPKMNWWKEAKFGMFIHWGLYSVPAGVYQGNEIGGIGEWIMKNASIPVEEYAGYAKQFNPTSFNADEWVKLARKAGMKYLVITSKHHDGFALFNSKVSDYDIIDATPFKRDIIGEMAAACKKYGIHFGLYYSQDQDWHQKGGGVCGTHWDKAQDGNFDEYLDRIAVPQVKEILTAYNPEIIWWDTPCTITKEGAAKFAPILAKYPKLITNNRLGGGVDGDLETPEQFIPATGIPGKNWESCMTMNDTWGFKKNDHNWKSTEMIVRNLIDIASKGGNYLLNVGPTQMGLIPDASIERLKEVGAWMKVNGEAIYGTSASPFSEITWGRVTQKKSGKNTILYLNVFDWPTDGKLVVSGLENKIIKVYPLANPSNKLQTEAKNADRLIDLSTVKQSPIATVIVVEISGKPVINNKPVINSESSTFIDKISIEITSDTKDGMIYYTVDGSEPTVNSQLSKGKMILQGKGTLIVKARTYVNGKPVSGIAVSEFKQQEPMAAIYESKQGLKYRYYEGNWSKLPDFSKLSVVKSGVTASLSLAEKNRPENYGFVFDGFINVPETSVYSFYLTSDDGSRLIIDEQKTLDNDGKHGMEEKSFPLALSAGLHKISVQFFQESGGEGLKLEWKPLGKEKSTLDHTFLTH